MKKKDITLVAVVVIFSSVFAIVISNFIFTEPEDQAQTVERVEVITSEFNEPSNDYFNEDSINPTKLIRIGDSDDNQSPFFRSDD